MSSETQPLTKAVSDNKDMPLALQKWPQVKRTIPSDQAKYSEEHQTNYHHPHRLKIYPKWGPPPTGIDTNKGNLLFACLCRKKMV